MQSRLTSNFLCSPNIVLNSDPSDSISHKSRVLNGMPSGYDVARVFA